MNFRFGLPIEIEQPGEALASTRKITVQVLYRAGKWTAQCQEPPVATLMCDSLEEALVTAAREIGRELTTPAPV